MLLGVSIAAVAVLVFFSRAIVEYIFRGARSLNRGVGAKFLKENFAPVNAEIEGEGLAVVEGSVPNDLVGAFCRIGPNPAHPPMGGYHWFDGDGMVHVCRIKDGKVSYANRWVQTTRLQHERERGEAVMLKFGDMKGRNGQLVLLIQMLRVMLGLASKPGFNNHEGGKVGTANTALVFHARKLLALHEGDLPHALRLLCSGVVETMGRIFEGEMSHPFTAHPKKDFKTGELCYIGYNMMGSPPTCTCGTLDKAGDIVREVTVSLEKPCMMHDVAITERFFVLIETPLVFYPKAMLKDDSLPITWRPELPTRFGLLERGADNESGVRWFTLEPAIHTFHTANAWEEGNKVLLFASTYEYMDLSLNPQPRNGKVAPEDEKPPPAMALITLDLDTGDVTHTVLDPAGAEFPVVRPNLTGRKCRYTYAASVNDQVKFTGLAKYDLQAPPGKSLVASVEYGEKMYGGEAVFVPKTDGEVPEEQEDDGYLATYVCNEGKSPLESYFMLYNAKNLALVAKVKLPQRVPYGFHGLWMSEAEVQEQE